MIGVVSLIHRPPGGSSAGTWIAPVLRGSVLLKCGPVAGTRPYGISL
jgi:hypothetical protein